MGLIYYSIGNLFFQIFLSIVLISLICRHNPDDHRALIFQKALYALIMWAAFDLLMVINQKFLSPDSAFRLFGLLSFMFLAFPPLATQMILSLIRELTRKEKNLIFIPYSFLYLMILVFPEFSTAKTFGIAGGFEGSLPPWNICFKVMSLGVVLVCAFLLLISSFKDQDKILKKEKHLLFLGVILFMFGTIISQVLIQINPNLPWFTNLSTAFFSITAFISLKKYGRIISSRALYETTVNISPNGISHILNEQIVWMNKSMAFFLDMNEVKNKCLEDIIHENQPPGMSKRQIIDGISNGSIRGKVIYIQDKTTDPRACLANCAPFELDNPGNGLLLILTDVSEENRIKKELFELNKKLENMAHTDSLTQIANRRRFDQILSREWQRTIRNQNPLSLIMLDIDYFKKYNDLYGHGKGDTCLYTVAQEIASKAKRPTDEAFRIGGEEFCVILPDTPFGGAKIIAEKIRSGIENLKIPHKDSEISECITVSIGICCANQFKEISCSKIIQTADKALYRAKESGRNRVEAIEIFENKT